MTMRFLLKFMCAAVVTMFLAGAVSVCAQGQSATDNLVANPGLEDGAKGWVLVTGKGEKGGRLVREPDGNHALAAEGDIYWVADTDRRGFAGLARERFAGKQLRLTFRAKGDRDAYPGAIVTWLNAGKAESVTLGWKTKYVQHHVYLDAAYKTYEFTRAIPPSVTAIQRLALYNCTRRGKIAFDDVCLSLVEPARAVAAQETPSFKEWESVELTRRELIELSNTCNSLVAEWACLYGLLLDLERAVYYRGGNESQTAALRTNVTQLRDKLLALQAFYTDRFQKTFGKNFTTQEPHRFYGHDRFAGRDLMLSVGAAKSRKPPFVELERSFQATRISIDGYLRQFQRSVTQAGAAKAVPSGEPLFGERFFPKRVLLGLRGSPAEWHATQWLHADFFQSSGNLVNWSFDGQERMRPNPDLYAAELKHYDPRWELTCWMDPRVLPVQHRPSFRAALDKDPELFAATERGPALRQQFQNVNIHHPNVQQYAGRFFEELGASFKDDKRVAMFEFLAEPAPFQAVEGINYTFGYSKAAKELFRSALKARFGSIAALNRAWASSYASFESIEPPNYVMMQEMAPANLPLIYEYRRFRKLAYADHAARVHTAYRKGDGGSHPVANRLARMYLNGSNFDPFDALRLAAESTDILCTHNCAEGSPRDRAEMVYYGSIADALNKPRGSFEYYPFRPEHNQFRPERHYGLTMIRRGLNNLWQALAWDVTTICAWIQNSIGEKGAGVWSPTRESGYTLLHDSAGAIALMKQQLRGGLEDVLLNTRIVKPAIAMLAPYDASLVCWPDGQVAVEGEAIHRFLEEQNRDYTYVHEQWILSGRDNLADVKVLFAPYVLWASRPLQDKLLDWVAKGGVLTSVGPFGFWDEYGRPSRALIDKAFGNVPIEMQRESLYTASLSYDALMGRPGVTVETFVPSSRGKLPNLIRANFGRGRIYITGDSTMDAILSQSRDVLRRAMDEAAGLRAAWSLNGSFHLVSRQRKNTTDRYLIVINRSVEKSAEDTVVVKGEYASPFDLCVAGGVPVPARASAGLTALKLRLGPGEGTCIRLGPYRPVQTSIAQADAFLGTLTASAASQPQSALPRPAQAAGQPAPALVLAAGRFTTSDAVTAQLLRVGKGSRIHLTGDVVLADVDALETLKACKFTSDTPRRLTLAKRVRFKLADPRGHPIRDTTIGLKVTIAGGSDAMLETRQRPDTMGAVVIELPAAIFEVAPGATALREMKYDVAVDDIAVTAGYVVKDVSPLVQTEYTVTCAINR
jgi:hypothetical protein